MEVSGVQPSAAFGLELLRRSWQSSGLLVVRKTEV